MITEHETIEDVGVDRATSKVDLKFFIEHKLRETLLKNEQNQVIVFEDKKGHHFEHSIIPIEVEETDRTLWSPGELDWINGICEKVMGELRSHGFDIDSAKIDISVSYKEAA